jgi:hypothetical protein
MEISDTNVKGIGIVPWDASPVRIIGPSKRSSIPCIPRDGKIHRSLWKGDVVCDARCSID